MSQLHLATPAVHGGPHFTLPDTVKRSLSVRAFGLTDPGLVRSSNEDQFLIADLTKALQVRQTSLRQSTMKCGHERGYLFLVADGVGGNRGGEHASALAVDSIEDFVLDTFRWFLQLKDVQDDNVLTELEAALRHTDAKVCNEASGNPELFGMGTTLTLAYTFNNDLFVAHVGDSRCYLFREGQLLQLTNDHTLAQEMINSGMLRPEEASQHQWRHVITNVVGGTEPGVRPEVHKHHLEEDDVLVLCSDGLTDMVPDRSIASLLKMENDPRRVCERLVTQANAAGGRDNVTVVVAHYEST